MVLNFNLTLSNDTIALYVSTSPTPSQKLMYVARVWISSADAASVAAKGFRFIHAASNSFYLARCQPTILPCES
jgi:hexosaminidase